MQIVPFPAYYQSVYTNFDFTSFSLISWTSKGPQLRCNCGPFTSSAGPFQARFWDQIGVNKIQMADCQHFKNVAKFACMHRVELLVANIASRESENGQIV